MYALHVMLSQRVMYEMPAPTMTLYALTWMGATVLIARLVAGYSFDLHWLPVSPDGWWFIIGLTVVTGLSRITLFAGVRNMGGLQTILLNMAEMGVTLIVAFLWLGERMSPLQWVGVLILLSSVVLSHWDSEVRDGVYRPLPQPTPFGGFRLDEPIEPDQFSTISRVYRRKPFPKFPDDESLSNYR